MFFFSFRILNKKKRRICLSTLLSWLKTESLKNEILVLCLVLEVGVDATIGGEAFEFTRDEVPRKRVPVRNARHERRYALLELGRESYELEARPILFELHAGSRERLRRFDQQFLFE